MVEIDLTSLVRCELEVALFEIIERIQADGAACIILEMQNGELKLHLPKMVQGRAPVMDEDPN